MKARPVFTDRDFDAAHRRAGLRGVKVLAREQDERMREQPAPRTRIDPEIARALKHRRYWFPGDTGSSWDAAVDRAQSARWPSFDSIRSAIDRLRGR